jgi:hypothetical protein
MPSGRPRVKPRAAKAIPLQHEKETPSHEAQGRIRRAWAITSWACDSRSLYESTQGVTGHSRRHADSESGPVAVATISGWSWRQETLALPLSL